MRAGQLTERVKLYGYTVTYDAYNEQRRIYIYQGTLKADIVASNANVSVMLEREVDTQSVTMSVRIYNNIHIGDRIEWRGETFDVVSVVPDRKISRLVCILKLADV